MNLERMTIGALFAILAQLGGCTAEQVYYDTPQAQAPAPAMAQAAPPLASIVPPAPRAQAPQPAPAPVPAAPAPLPAAPVPGAGQFSAAQLAEFDRKIAAEWLAAVRATPQLKERIAQGATYGSVMAQADRMAQAGLARLDMSDLHLVVESELRMMDTPGICDASGTRTTPSTKEIGALLQTIGLDNFKRFQDLRIKALRAESAHSGTLHTVTPKEFIVALGMTIRTLPFEQGRQLRELFAQGPGTAAREKCLAGHLLLEAGLRMPQPYRDTIAIGALNPRILRDITLPPSPAPDPSVPKPHGPQLGI